MSLVANRTSYLLLEDSKPRPNASPHRSTPGTRPAASGYPGRASLATGISFFGPSPPYNGAPLPQTGQPVLRPAAGPAGEPNPGSWTAHGEREAGQGRRSSGRACGCSLDPAHGGASTPASSLHRAEHRLVKTLESMARLRVMVAGAR